jgi:endonuclease G
MNARRRTAFFAATNIDAERKVSGIGRDGIDWTMDERVGDAQLGREAYRGTGWDRGHLCRREDVIWGRPAEARAANRSTFFYTNSALQHFRFNQDEWLALEDWVLHHATDFSYRLCVFAGPVLSDDDPAWWPTPRDRAIGPEVRVPVAFWKVIALRDETAGGDDLSVVAFAMKQVDMWNDRDGARMLDLTTHQVPVRTIERWTGLRSGALRNADELVWSDERERALGPTEPFPVIKAPDDLRFNGEQRRAEGFRTVPAGRSAAARSRSMPVRAGDCGCNEARSNDEVVAALARRVDDLAKVVFELSDQPMVAPRDAVARAVADLPGGPAREDAFARTLADVRGRGTRMPVRALAERIVGGVPIGAGEHPSCVVLGDAQRWLCTGTLIAPRVVLTAAHCRELTRIMIRSEDIWEKPGEVIDVLSTHLHPGYQGQTHANDISLLILDKPADVATTRLATDEELRLVGSVVLAGFGNSDVWSTSGFGVKRAVTVPILPIKVGDAEGEFGEWASEFGYDPEFEFVGGRKRLGMDSCNGDSGGPAYAMVPGSGFILAGVTSRATISGRLPCGDGGIYVRPARHREWIEAVIARHGLSLS